MSNKELTALEWLIEQWPILEAQIPPYILEQAKEMEKEQHQETFKQSRQAKIFEKDMPPVWECWEQYYNKTFGGKDEQQ
jgi:hypothetical protein